MKIVLLLLTAIQLHSTSAQGTTVQEPGDVIYHPDVTTLPIELTCDVSPAALWSINGDVYAISMLLSGSVPGHNVSGRNILINNPINNSQYFCSDGLNEGELYRIFIAGLPAIVPDVKVDNNTININGDIITIIVSWGEPFNNFDPIVNYTVSCSGDVTCPPNFTTTDNTTRSYIITNLTSMTTYTFSVVATNSIGSGEAGVVMITTPPVISQVTGVNLTCEVGNQTINQCTVTWDAVTQENITGYQVYYNGTMISVTSSTTTLTFNAPSLPDGVFTGTVVVRVTAVRGSEVGLASNPASAVIIASSVIRIISTLASFNVTSEEYNINVTCIIHRDSTADKCVVMAVNDSKENTGSASITNEMATVTVNGLKCNVTYTIIAGGTLNGDLVGLRSSHGIINQLCLSENFLYVASNNKDNLASAGIGFAIGVGVSIGVAVGVAIIVIIICRRKRNTVGPRSSHENVDHLLLPSQTLEKGRGGGGDGVTVKFNNPVYSVNKYAGPAQLVLVLNKPSPTVITVKVTSNNRSATGEGVNHISGPYNVIFHAGQTKATFDVPINDADKLKANADFMLTIDKTLLPRNVTCGSPGQATLTIVHDDITTVMFSKPVYCVNKNSGPAQPTLVLSKPSTTNIIVKVTSDGRSATGEGVDGPYTVKFSTGEAIATFDIPIKDYDKLKVNEYFILTIDKASLPRDVTCGSYGQATVNIVDGNITTVMFSKPVYCVNKNAGPAQPTLVLSKPSTTDDITVKVTSDGRSATGEGVDGPHTVKFPAGNTFTTFDVSIKDDDKLKGNEYMLTIDKTSLPKDVTCGGPGQATVNIVNDDSDKHGSDENNKKSAKKNEGITYAELDPQKGPGKFGDGEHVLNYGEVTDAKKLKKKKATQLPQDEFALADKSKSDPSAAKQMGGTYYAVLDIRKGPSRFGDGDHGVQYAETKH